MTLETLDLYVPWISLLYGAICLLVLETPHFGKLSHRLPPAMVQQLQAHRGLALVCMVVGFFWVLQNIWFYNN